MALQHGQQIVYRNILDHRIADRGHIVVGHIARGDHPVQLPVLIGDGEDRKLVLLHHLPSAADGDARGEDGWRVIVQVLDLGAQVSDQHGGLRAEAVQDRLSFVADLSQAGRLVLPVAQSVFQRGVGHGRHNGVCVRVPVSGNIDRIHSDTSFFVA